MQQSIGRSSDVNSPAKNPTVVRGNERADLALIYDPDVMLVTVPAPPSADALAHARGMLGDGLWHDKVEVPTPGGVPASGALDRLAVGSDDTARAWVAYLEEVTGVFAYLLEAEVVGVRQVVADGPHCPRFHLDQVHARGVLTVLGATTEWFENPDIDRTRLGHAGGADDTTSGLVTDWSRLQRADVGRLAVFKGTMWPEASSRAIAHRSPPPNGERRLLLTLDWLD